MSATALASVQTAEQNNANSKRRQPKSRNGCATCKAKRRKCDETKPKCKRCISAKQECEGYRVELKFKPVEGTSFVEQRPGAKRKAAAKKQSSLTTGKSNGTAPLRVAPENGSAGKEQESSFSVLSAPNSAHETSPTEDNSQMSFEAAVASFSEGSPLFATGASGTDSEKRGFDNQSENAENLCFSDQGTNSESPIDEAGLDIQLIDPMEDSDPLSDPEIMVDTEYIEPLPGFEMQLACHSPSTSSSSSSGSLSWSFSPTFIEHSLGQATWGVGGLNWTKHVFDHETCGILSIKNGQTENPWRTLIMPYLEVSPELYHAVAAMACFHLSRSQPELRKPGIQHKNKCLKLLQKEIERISCSGTESLTTPLHIITTILLVLAFSETWDQPEMIWAGQQHIKGAYELIKRGWQKHQDAPCPPEEFNVLKFLTNTHLYIDTISRLTSVERDEIPEFKTTFAGYIGWIPPDNEIDPLMGCAGTLFPVIGRVTDLVHKVMHSQSNSLPRISEATRLKKELERWKPPDFDDSLEDASTIEDAKATAEAYRYAALLLLCQAVPELSSLNSEELAQRVLFSLAKVPEDSPCLILHMFPISTAGCEAATEEDRGWVRQRFELLAQWLRIGNVDLAFDVVNEVWARRDMYGQNPKAASKASANSHMDPERTVRGKLHWMGVMRDWKWEGEFTSINMSSAASVDIGGTLHDLPSSAAFGEGEQLAMVAL